MNTIIHIMLLLLSIVCVPLSTECMGLLKKKHKNSLTLPVIKPKRQPLTQRLKAALLKKKPVSASVTPITSPGLVASHTPTKTPQALSQVRREPSSKPPLLLQSLSPLSPTSPDGLHSPLLSATNSSGRSELSALSSPSSVSTASPLPSPSPDMESMLGIATSPSHGVDTMLHTSPEISPVQRDKRDSSPRDFSPLPAPALVVQEEDSPASQHVHVGSLGDEKPRVLLQAAGSMRDDVEDDGDHDIQVMGQEDTWTPLMRAVFDGNVIAVKKMSYTFDIEERHSLPGYAEKESACTLAIKCLADIREQLEKNPIWVSERYCPDTMFEREVMKPVRSSDVGRPRWFAYYKEKLALFAEMDQNRPLGWDIEQIENDLRLNPSDAALQSWYKRYHDAARNMDIAYEEVSDEDSKKYEQLTQLYGSYKKILKIFEDKRLESQRA